MSEGTMQLKPAAPLLAALLATVALLGQQSAPPVPQRLRIVADTPPPPAPPSSERHAYFESLAARADRAYAYSLRNQAELDEHVAGPPPSENVTYNPVEDRYPEKQDAAKVVVPSGRASIGGAVRLPIEVGPGLVLITWDAWWGPEWVQVDDEFGNMKTFQVSSPFWDGDRWLELRNRFRRAADSSISSVDVRTYSNILGPEVTDRAPVSPQVGHFEIAASTWTRYWLLIEIRSEDLDRVSLWMADERRDAVMLLDHVRIDTGSNSIIRFWLEYNSSGSRNGGAPLVGYVRNLVALRGISDPRPLFQRPLR